MLTINFAAFPLSMSRKSASKMLKQHLEVTANLPMAGRKLFVCVPPSGIVVFENVGNDIFSLTAVPITITTKE